VGHHTEEYKSEETGFSPGHRRVNWMANVGESDSQLKKPSPELCPKCRNLTSAQKMHLSVFGSTPCPICGEQIVPGLLARTTDYEDQGNEDFSRFHVREGSVAGFYLTETQHPAGYRIPRHSHQVPSLYLLLAGSLMEQFGRENAERHTAEVIFTPADRPHSNVFLGRGGRCLIVELNTSWNSRMAHGDGLPTELKSFRGQPAWLANRLHNEFCSSDLISPLVIEGLVLEIIGEICRQSSQRRGFAAVRKVIEAREFLDAAFSQSISLDDVAGAVELHPVYLARAFRRTYRCSVGEYLRRRRVEMVCAQLLASDKPLAEIASEAGFCDQAHLTRIFHKLIGTTPGQYRAVRGASSPHSK